MTRATAPSIASIAIGLALCSLAACAQTPIETAHPVATALVPLAGHEQDFNWLVGTWKVRHHRLKERLSGCTEWEDFNGTSTLWLTMGGLGTVDDNLLELPSGTYRAMGVRMFDPKAEQWLVWWHDGRNPTALDPPLKGGFKDGEGTFFADDFLRGKPIKERFRWTHITPRSAHWEQAFSPDGGTTWEVNWEMDLVRAQ
jgi:hypothetical protein